MENKYLNLTGAVYIISKIKTLLGDKSDKGHTHSKEEIGLGNVENKSSQTIRGELTSDNVIKALGYTPPKENTTYAVMKGATASAAGTSGLVPAPAAGDQGKYLRGDGTYGTPTNTTSYMWSLEQKIQQQQASLHPHRPSRKTRAGRAILTITWKVKRSENGSTL